MKPISKSIFLKYLQCPKLAWHLYRDLIKKENSFSDNFLIFESKKIHSAAQLLFKDAVKVQAANFQEAILKTKQLIQDKNVNTIFEPAFEYNGFIAKTDILKRTDTGWQIIEIKSGNKCKNKYISDLAYCCFIASKNIQCINKASLFLLSKNFYLSSPVNLLFSEKDCSFEVFSKAEEIEKTFEEIKTSLTSETVPQANLKLICKNCPLFLQCVGKDIKYHIFDLPRLSAKIFEQLKQLNISKVEDVPDTIELTPAQKIVKDCIVNDKIFINPNLKNDLNKLKLPFYYLDFESMMTIYPVYTNIAPHSQIITQYSLHKVSDLNFNKIEHFEFIADPKKDCRKQLIMNLIENLQTEGSIITYSDFEHNIILNLIKLFPELSEKIHNIAERIVDFEVILRNNYYDKNFHGRTSIKKVLPVLVKNMNYDNLDIAEGGSASAHFAYMAMNMYSKEKEEEIKKELLQYCCQDTLALVKIHQFLTNCVNNQINNQRFQSSSLYK